MVPRRVLVTGGTGFVGNHLRTAIAARWPGARVIPLGVGTLGGDVRTIDLLDPVALAAVVEETRPDAVIHLAAQASVARSAEDAADTWSVNLGGSLNLANAVARHVPDACVLFASSSEVYGASFLDGPVVETTPLQPANAYAKSKALAERMFADVLPPATRLLVVRPFNHTGPGQAPTFVLPSFARQIARMEAGLQPPRLDVGNLDVAREFLDVRDVVDAYLRLIEISSELPSRFTCNVATGDARPLRERVEMLRGMTEVAFEIAVDPARLRAVDVPIASGDASLLRQATGWNPCHNIAETLASVLDTARAAVRKEVHDAGVS